MAHVGQELGLGAVGLFRMALGRLKTTGHATLPDQHADGGEGPEGRQSDDPALGLDHVGLQRSVGARGLELATTLGQLGLHVARDLADASTEDAAGQDGFLPGVLAKQGERVRRAALGMQQFGLDMGDFGQALLPELTGSFHPTDRGQVAFGTHDVAGSGARDGSQRQQLRGHELRRAETFAMRSQTGQDPARIVASIGDDGAEFGIVDRQAFQGGALRQPVMNAVEP